MIHDQQMVHDPTLLRIIQTTLETKADSRLLSPFWDLKNLDSYLHNMIKSYQLPIFARWNLVKSSIFGTTSSNPWPTEATRAVLAESQAAEAPPPWSLRIGSPGGFLSPMLVIPIFFVYHIYIYMIYNNIYIYMYRCYIYVYIYI